MIGQSSVHDPGWGEWVGRLTLGQFIAGLIGFIIGSIFILTLVFFFSESAYLERAMKRQLKYSHRFSKDKNRTLPEGEDYEVKEVKRQTDPRMRM